MALAIRKLKEAFARSFANVEELPGHEITSRTMSNLLWFPCNQGYLAWSTVPM